MKTNPGLARIAFRYAGGFAALFLLCTPKLSAQKSQVEEKTSIEVLYQEAEGDYFVFKVNITYSGTKKPVLKVFDDKLELLYSELIPVESYSKTFKVPKDDVQGLQFRVYSGKEIIKKIFEIRKAPKEFIEMIEKDS